MQLVDITDSFSLAKIDSRFLLFGVQSLILSYDPFFIAMVLPHSEQSPDSSDTPTFSFAGCSWLMTYHLGVGLFLREYFNTHRMRFAGASSGSLIALAMATKMDLNDVFQFILSVGKESKRRFLGPVGRMTNYLSRGIDEFLPRNAYRTVSGRIYISITELPFLRNRLIAGSELCSDQELITVILASSYIPVYYEKPIIYKRRLCVDGGLTNNCPRLNRNTIRVSPKPSLQLGHFDISPIKEPPTLSALIPEIDQLEPLMEQGYWDCERFANSPSGRCLKRIHSRKPGH